MMVKAQAPSLAPGENAEGQDETYYTDLLKMKLDNSIKDAGRLGDELSLQRMKSLSESQRALELERKLFTAERMLKQVQSDKIKLQLRVEELQHKYEPKVAKKNLLQKRKKEKLSVDILPSCEKLEDSKQPVRVVMDMVKNSDLKTVTPPAAEEVHIKKEPEERPTKTVKIRTEEPVVIPNPSSCLTDCNVKTEDINQQNVKEERRKKQKTVEVIHVKSSNSMENQCAQQ